MKNVLVLVGILLLQLLQAFKVGELLLKQLHQFRQIGFNRVQSLFHLFLFEFELLVLFSLLFLLEFDFPVKLFLSEFKLFVLFKDGFVLFLESLDHSFDCFPKICLSLNCWFSPILRDHHPFFRNFLFIEIFNLLKTAGRCVGVLLEPLYHLGVLEICIYCLNKRTLVFLKSFIVDQLLCFEEVLSLT